MKNMDVLIDTNILLNYITNREDAYLEPSVKIVELCAEGSRSGIHNYLQRERLL